MYLCGVSTRKKAKTIKYACLKVLASLCLLWTALNYIFFGKSESSYINEVSSMLLIMLTGWFFPVILSLLTLAKYTSLMSCFVAFILFWIYNFCIFSVLFVDVYCFRFLSCCGLVFFPTIYFVVFIYFNLIIVYHVIV